MRIKLLCRTTTKVFAPFSVEWEQQLPRAGSQRIFMTGEARDVITFLLGGSLGPRRSNALTVRHHSILVGLLVLEAREGT
jgi:hypothetical protein